jgi:hypothetical protein
MKNYVISWTSHINGMTGCGKKLLEKEAAEHLAAELNKNHPDIHHEAAIPAPTLPEPATPVVQ